MVIEYSQTVLFYVVPWSEFIARHGPRKFDKNIAEEFRDATKKEKTRHICSTIQNGIIFAWESVSRDRDKEFEFALSINFREILLEHTKKTLDLT